MEKEAYAEKSKELGLPCRCPLVGYCGRWAVTEYIRSSYESEPESNLSHAVHWLGSEGRLPDDHGSKKVAIALHSAQLPRLENCENINRVDSLRMTNVCPDAMLGIAGVAATSAIVPDWECLDEEYENEPVTGVRPAHFSECFEFIQSAIGQQYYSAGKKSSRIAIPASVRFSVLKRDGFECVYCGAKRSDGARLEADHKISVKDGGTNDMSNLVCACLTCNRGKGAGSV